MRLIIYLSVIIQSIFICESHSQKNYLQLTNWKGTLTDSLSSFSYDLKIEKIIGNKCFGTSVSSNNDFYCKTRFLGIIKDSKLTIYESEIIKTNYKDKESICLLALTLIISNGTIKGNFRPINNISNCLSGNVFLRIVETTNTAIEKNNLSTLKNETINIIRDTSNKNLDFTKPTSSIKIINSNFKIKEFYNRKTDLIKEILVNEDEIDIMLFDNGIIDGDSISLLDNDKIIFENKMLSTTPLKYHLSNEGTEIHDLLFFANNLGSIPPNTGLMVITSKSNRMELNFSSDYLKSSLIRIKLKTK